jgi:putative hydrolase of HD superfamily
MAEGAQLPPRLLAQVTFLAEVDRLKQVLRRTTIMDGSRRENTAEHSWHVALAAVVLAEWGNVPVDLTHVVKMLLVHDIVEIDAGDTFAYDAAGKLDQHARETKAAARLFGLLPDDQAQELRGLWEEFEARATAASLYANAIDRLLPVLQNFANGGGTWHANGVHRGRVLERLRPIDDGAHEVWRYVELILDEAEARGYLLPVP